MTIALDHMSVPTRDRAATAEFYAEVFGLTPREPRRDYLPVPVSQALTLNLQEQAEFSHNHYAYRVSADEFEAIQHRLRTAHIPFGSAVDGEDGQVYERGGLRGFYFSDPNGHGLEVLSAAAAS